MSEENQKQSLGQILATHWPGVASGVVLLVAVGIVAVNTMSVERKLQEVPKLEDKVGELTKRLDAVNSKEVQKEVEIVKEQTSNARDIGAKVVAAQDALATYYLSPLFDQTSSVSKETADKEAAFMTSVLNGIEMDPSQTWKQNTNWTLELGTIVNYKEKLFPVLFLMYTKNKELAGVVQTKYDASSEQFSDVVVQYTPKGRETGVLAYLESKQDAGSSVDAEKLLKDAGWTGGVSTDPEKAASQRYGVDSGDVTQTSDTISGGEK